MNSRRDFVKKVGMMAMAASAPGFAAGMATAVVSCDGKTEPDPDPEPDPTPAEYLPDWREGYLDIHHIATGQGDCTFIICPDGTTMLVDAGDVGGKYDASITPAVPDESKTPGEWIADYVNHFSKDLPVPGTLDYAWITHFHGDHIGNVNTAKAGTNGYKLCGITMVGEHVAIKKIVDRGWPDYNFPSRAAIEGESGGFWKDYYAFLNYLKDHQGTEIDKFATGSNTQFVLKHKAAQYGDFSVRNIYANGILWTGTGANARTLYTASDVSDENMHSCVIKMSYGSFSYFAGGDLSGYNHPNYASKKREIEVPVGQVAGKVTVLKANHHGTYESTQPDFLRSLTPQAIVITACHVLHPDAGPLSRMVDPLVYEGDRSIYTTRYTDGHKSKLGAAGNVIKPAGHIVVRAYAGGAKYRMFVLDSETTDYPVIYQTDEINVNK
jgi:beta-lactamase superfamily II metal-dependent hydrolase